MVSRVRAGREAGIRQHSFLKGLEISLAYNFTTAHWMLVITSAIALGIAEYIS